jgi:hypothetical protein
MPISLLQVDHAFFVEDGHKRLSVAIAEGRRLVDANVDRFETRFHVAPGTTMASIRVTASERRFRKVTGLEAAVPRRRFPLSDTDGYLELQESVKAHTLDFSRAEGRLVSPEEGALHWCETVFEPILELIDSTGMCRLLESMTEADRFLLFRRGIDVPMLPGWRIPRRPSSVAWRTSTAPRQVGASDWSRSVAARRTARPRLWRRRTARTGDSPERDRDTAASPPTSAIPRCAAVRALETGPFDPRSRHEDLSSTRPTSTRSGPSPVGRPRRRDHQPDPVRQDYGRTYEDVLKEICSITRGPVSGGGRRRGCRRHAHGGPGLREARAEHRRQGPDERRGPRGDERFAEEGIKTNCTLIFTANQGLLAAKAGASLLSPVRRPARRHQPGRMIVIRELVEIVAIHELDTEVLAGVDPKPVAHDAGRAWPAPMSRRSRSRSSSRWSITR